MTSVLPVDLVLLMLKQKTPRMWSIDRLRYLFCPVSFHPNHPIGI